MPQPDEAKRVLEEKALQLDVGTLFHEAFVFLHNFEPNYSGHCSCIKLTLHCKLKPEGTTRITKCAD